jgi:hypothetical protein
MENGRTREQQAQIAAELLTISKQMEEISKRFHEVLSDLVAEEKFYNTAWDIVAEKFMEVETPIREIRERCEILAGYQQAIKD